jgi:hypothetical protein
LKVLFKILVYQICCLRSSLFSLNTTRSFDMVYRIFLMKISIKYITAPEGYYENAVVLTIQIYLVRRGRRYRQVRYCNPDRNIGTHWLFHTLSLNISPWIREVRRDRFIGNVQRCNANWSMGTSTCFTTFAAIWCLCRNNSAFPLFPVAKKAWHPHS